MVGWSSFNLGRRDFPTGKWKELNIFPNGTDQLHNKNYRDHGWICCIWLRMKALKPGFPLIEGSVSIELETN